MKIELKPGKYVVAVSGGVDSIVLLDVLSKLKGSYEFIVAHYDHGIRPDSNQDRTFVEGLASKYELDFYFEEGNLGPKASEALARGKRYEFLRKIKNKTKSDAIVTAHHKDDLLETAIINMLRGTGRKGLASLQSTDGLKRPLLDFSKKQLLDYAKTRDLKWREDITNLDQKYLRNYVRHSLATKLTQKQKQSLLDSIQSTKQLSEEIEELLKNLSSDIFEKDKIKRSNFQALPHEISKELLADWLRQRRIAFDSNSLERLVIFAKTARLGAKTNVVKDYELAAGKDFISLSKGQSV